MSRSGEDIRLDEVVKVGILGEGSQGSVWIARKRGSRSPGSYALKQRLVKRRDARMYDTKTSSVLREIEFYKKVANRYPTHFSKLYDWDLSLVTPEVKEAFKNEKNKDLSSYTHVLTTLSARKEGVLKSVYRTLDRAAWLSMLAQVCYAISLIHDRGFSHGDVWEANVAYVKVPHDRMLPIYRSSVPSCGYEWSIIDYGSVELTDDETLKERTKKRSSSYELDDMISLASGEDDAEEVCKNNGEDVESPEFRRRVLSSDDGPSVRLMMKKTGLHVRQALALVNLDSYLWYVCKSERTCDVKPWIDRDSLMRLAAMQASYRSLAIFFARLAREAYRPRKR